MRIPITMCHGLWLERTPLAPLDTEHFVNYFRIASEMGFESISYDDLELWLAGEGELPAHPIMFDFDHADKTIYHDIFPIMQRLGFAGNLFIYTAPLEEMYATVIPDRDGRKWMTWDEVGELMDAGWNIGSHTHTHPDLSELSLEDPSGEKVRQELAKCDEILKRELGIDSKDFAFVGISWSTAAEEAVKKRYRFGRLWIKGATYQADGKPIRYADLVGVPGEDMPDGGPPAAARYITKESDPYRLPSMELGANMIFDYDKFREYLDGAFTPS